MRAISLYALRDALRDESKERGVEGEEVTKRGCRVWLINLFVLRNRRILAWEGVRFSHSARLRSCFGDKWRVGVGYMLRSWLWCMRVKQTEGRNGEKKTRLSSLYLNDYVINTIILHRTRLSLSILTTTMLYLFVLSLLALANASALTTAINPNERLCFYADVDKAGQKIGVCLLSSP